METTMDTEQQLDIEAVYRQFQLGKIPIFYQQQLISIGKLFWILTTHELKDLPTIEAMNLYLYCNFFKNRLLYSEIFTKNLTYINSKLVELTDRVECWLKKYEQMLKEIKSESDITWVSNNITLLNEGLTTLKSIPNYCDYYDQKIARYLDANSANYKSSTYLQHIESECATEFTTLSKLFSEIGRIIGRI